MKKQPYQSPKLKKVGTVKTITKTTKGGSQADVMTPNHI